MTGSLPDGQAGNTEVSKRWHGLITALLLIVVCIAINFLGARLALALSLPVFFDCVGTVIAGALGGYIPGVIVGFLSNLVIGAFDLTTIYYAIINVMIAFAAALLARKDAFRRFGGIIAAIACFALIGGGIGSILTWNLYGGGFGEGISAPLAHAIHDNGVESIFLAQLYADILLDLLDKTICVLLVAAVLALLPKWVKDACNFYGWRNSGMKERLSLRKLIKREGVSLQKKIVLMIAISTGFIAIAVTVISILHYHNTLLEEKESFGIDVAKLVAEQIDAEKVDAFLEEGTRAEGYLETKEKLQQIFDVSSNVDYIYVYRIEKDGCHVVFDLDTPDLKGEEPGTLISFDESFSDLIPKLLAGEEVDPIVTNDTYGWLLTVYIPVRDSEGQCQCYAATDISMSRVSSADQIFLTKIIALFAGAVIMLMAIGLSLAKAAIIHPIISMAEAANAFAYTDAETREETIESIRNLNIHTGDEVEYLYGALLKTTEDTAKYINDAQEQNQRISDLQNGLIAVMADLVESRDQCTGDHIKKTAAYVRVIVEQMKEDGIYAESITDEYIEDLAHSAPLHDIGKIRVPDMILNKPGKLTEEEFEIMKMHTVWGGEAIENAMTRIDTKQAGYLKEARNMAIAHHEKWNGSGYPYHLSGEQIPLSARIMAVADVFDALVSRRSYKKGMPFEKVMGIITEGAGTHFDPMIVEAFVHAQEKAREISLENMDVEIGEMNAPEKCAT